MTWTDDEVLLAGLLSLLVAGILFLAAIGPAKEAATFNKYRDADSPPATYWDAVFSDLRITTK
jgi:hypothetical protein